MLKKRRDAGSSNHCAQGRCRRRKHDGSNLTTELVPRLPVFSDDANRALQQLAQRYVALVSRLPAVKAVLLEGIPPDLQLCTVIEADPQGDFPDYEQVYGVEEEATQAVLDAPALNFRVVNRTTNPSRDFESAVSKGIYVLFQR